VELVEAVKKVLMENPSILVEVLVAKPEILYQALAKIAPWQLLATKEDIRRLEEKMATKEDVKRLEERVAALERRFDSEMRRLETTITALGARWGVLSEEAFREGVRRLLAEAGWAVEKVMLFDREGYVYGEPSEVEYDVVVKDGKTFLVEITSALKRSDLPTLRRKREYFEKAKGVKVDAVFVVTPFIHDRVPERVKAMAKDMGIEVVYPTDTLFASAL